MKKWFKQTNSMMRRVREGSLFSLDTNIVEKELDNFFDNCNLSPYLKKDLRKIIRKLQRESKLDIFAIRQDDSSVPYARKTTIFYSTRCWYDFGFKEYQYCWD